VFGCRRGGGGGGGEVLKLSRLFYDTLIKYPI